MWVDDESKRWFVNIGTFESKSCFRSSLSWFVFPLGFSFSWADWTYSSSTAVVLGELRGHFVFEVFGTLPFKRQEHTHKTH